MTNRQSQSLGRTVLCVDDDVHLTDLLQYALTREGYNVRVAHDGATAVRLVDLDPPDVAILDANLPDTDGFTLCVQLRSGFGIPVIMLTARQSDEDQIAGLGRGADDYIIKPFNMQILIHRLRAVIQRAYPVVSLRNEARSYQVGSGVFNPEHSQIVSGTTMVKLTPTESKILALLLHHEGNPVPAQRIMNHVWGFDTESEIAVVKTHVRRLRTKITQAIGSISVIQTVPNVGYMFRQELMENGSRHVDHPEEMSC